MASKQSTTFTENWKPVVGWEGFYEVSDMGRVRSLPRRVQRRTTSYPVLGGIMTPRRNKYTEHKTVLLRRPGEHKYARIHRLVLEAFVGPCPDGMEGCHTNDIADDNRLANLRWATHRDNAKDAKRNNRYEVGSKHHEAKLDECAVMAIRRKYREGVAQHLLVKQFRVSAVTIHNIVRFKGWKHLPA